MQLLNYNYNPTIYLQLNWIFQAVTEAFIVGLHKIDWIDKKETLYDNSLKAIQITEK